MKKEKLDELMKKIEEIEYPDWNGNPEEIAANLEKALGICVEIVEEQDEK